MRGLAVALGLTSALVVACTHDFDVFDTEGARVSADASAGGGANNPDGSTGASGRSSDAGGTSGGGGSAATAGGTANAGGASDASAGTGGALPGDDGGSTGGTATGGAPGTGGGADAAPPCAPSQKLCSLACVSRDSPATGCDSPSCSACSLANATAALCAGGTCAPVSCNRGFGDCNPNRADGCEANLVTDARNCGDCGNDCTQQNGKECISSVCGCTTNQQCRVGQSAATITCDTATNLCHCDAATCRRGESCSRQGACACNGQPACTGSQTCCRSPAGCRDLGTDATSCGACGHACATGFVCTTGACHCDGDGDCGNGSAGTCTEGVCHCDAATCAPGERCIANGQCG